MPSYLNRGKQAGGLTYKAKEPKFSVSVKAPKSVKKPYSKPSKYMTAYQFFIRKVV
jgi:hypothetical protein